MEVKSECFSSGESFDCSLSRGYLNEANSWVLVFRESCVNNEISLRRPFPIFNSIDWNRFLLAFRVSNQFHGRKLINRETLLLLHDFFRAIFFGLDDVLYELFSQVFAIKRPLISMKIFTLLLIKVSYLLNQLEVPDNIRIFWHRCISKNILLTWRHADWINLRLRNCNDRLHVFATMEFYLIMLNHDKICALRTVEYVFITLNSSLYNIGRFGLELMRFMPL